MPRMADRGDAYVAAWPENITRQIGISREYVADAMRRAGLVDGATETRIRRPLLRGERVDEVAALTPDTARRVIAELRAIAAEISRRERTHCSTCGLPLAGGTCRECV